MRQFVCFLCGVIFLVSCHKDDSIRQLSFPAFSASVNGNAVEFMAPVTARSEKNPNGGYDLTITGEHRVSSDSSNLITFVIPDFTISGSSAATHTLNTAFKGNFVEWKWAPGSSNGKYHFFQQGQLVVQQDAHKYLAGSFHFTYFLFNQQGVKTGEVQVSDGNFKDIIIER